MLVETRLRLGCQYEPPLPEEGAAYADYLGRLLDSPPRLLPESGSEENGDGAELDLLLYWEPERPRWQRWLRRTPAVRLVDHNQASVLVVRRPRWPLRRILLILRADETDEAAIQWLGRLAPPAQADVFVLPIIPPVPAMYSLGRLPLQTETLMASNTFSGAQLQRLSALCAAWGIEARLLLHESEPHRRIEWAAETSECDLIILSDEPYHWIHRHLLGELVQPLLHDCDRPVLIAKDTTHR